MKRIDTAQIRIDHYRCIDNGQQWGPLTAELSGNTYLTSRMRKLGHFFWENALVSRVTLVCSLRVLGLYRVVYKPRWGLLFSEWEHGQCKHFRAWPILVWDQTLYRPVPSSSHRARAGQGEVSKCVCCVFSLRVNWSIVSPGHRRPEVPEAICD